METVTAYSLGSLAWLGCQALPLIIWPTFISSLLSSDYQHADVVEQYFARSLGFSQLTIGLMLVVLTGVLPLTSSVDGNYVPTVNIIQCEVILADTGGSAPENTVSPYANAVVLVSMFHHSAGAFHAYARYNSSGQMGYLLGCLGSSVFAVFGLWVVMFAGDKGHISRRTGADKRTSGWPFKNTEADRKRKSKKAV